MARESEPRRLTSSDPWDPQQYERFREQRQQPFFDLLGLVKRGAPGTQRVADLGCGTGELTRSLHRHLQARSTLGLDSSPSMLSRSAAFAEPGLRFEQQDIAQFAPAEPYDVIFSNAALQWLPDHRDLLARLTGALAADGQLAVQVPANYDHPSHRVAAEVAAESPFAEALGAEASARRSVLLPEQYADCLDRLNYREQIVQLRVYGHHLSGPEDVVEWVKGTLLNDYRLRMDAALFQRFLIRYRERLLPRLEERRPYFYPFKRILLWARR